MMVTKRSSGICRLAAVAIIVGLTASAWAEYQVVEVKNGGSIKGAATWKGDVPKLDELKVNADTNVCGKTTPSPALKVDAATKGVKFVLVYLETVAQGKEPEKKYWLHMGKDSSRPDSEACKFEEHVWPFVRTSTIALENYDRILHNPHGFAADRATLFNIALPVPKMETDEHFKRVVGVGLRYQCEIHTSMNGWMAGFDHPYFATTDAKGAYEIKDIPPGKYKLVAWHEGYTIAKTESGRPVYDDPHVISKDVEVKAGEALQVDFTFPTK